MKITTGLIKKKLEEVMDPELNISIVDLGLVYKVEVKKANHVKITMTLTTAGCPLVGMIEDEIKNKISELGINRKSITIKLTFEPPWSMDMMSKKAKSLLGI